MNKNDQQYILKCIELAEKGTQYGEFPFGSVIVLNDKIIAGRHNESLSKNEVYRHAEMLALLDAQSKLTPEELSQCIIYSNVEPCPMCSFAIQELNIRKVVFGMRSPIMGGYSKWKVLQDEEINATFPNTFGNTPEIVHDVLTDKVIESWKKWNKEKWDRLVKKGVFKE